MGLLMMGLFLYDLNSRHGNFFQREVFYLGHCSAVKDKLELLDVAQDWEINCDRDNIEIIVQYPIDSSQEVKDLRPILYRKLANTLKQIGNAGPKESLEKVLMIRLEIQAGELKINAITEGQYVAQLSSLKNTELIAKHLQATVQVKEVGPSTP